MFCSHLCCSILVVDHLVSEIYLKWTLVQMMPESSPVSIHFLLHPLNRIQMMQWERDSTLPCMCMNKSIGISKWQRVHPGWAMKQGSAKIEERGKRCYLWYQLCFPGIHNWLRSSGRKQRPCGRHLPVGLHQYGHLLCLVLQTQILLTRYSKCRQG